MRLCRPQRVRVRFRDHQRFADEICEVVNLGVEIGMVIGGGNIVRGANCRASAWTASAADYMGMLGTVINALALQDILERRGSTRAS